MENRKLLTAAILSSLFLPLTTSAQADFFFAKLVNKISTLAYSKPIITSNPTEIVPPIHIAENPTKEIIDTYSGIKLNLNETSVSFKYLGEPDTNIRTIDQADPASFALIETGTYILATDKNALYIIYGYDVSRFTDIDLPSLEIKKDQYAEIESLSDKNNQYKIEKTQLIPF